MLFISNRCLNFTKTCIYGRNSKLLEMVNKAVNLFWKKGFSQNLMPLGAAEVHSSETLNKLGLAWVPVYAPCFYLNSKQIRILTKPQEYYELLLEQIQKAEKRIVLASLYFGNGPLEENLIIALKSSLEKNSGLKVKILLDCFRGSRGEINSRKMLIPLLKDFENSCQVNLYQTPLLRGNFLPFLPEKYKEVVGLQHIKMYLFDDNFIITGANLSNDYFSKRQDRYMFLSNCKDISDFIEGFINKLSDFSFFLNKDDKLSFSQSWPYNPLKSNPNTFNLAASAHIRNYFCGFLGNLNPDENDTVLFPLLEMGPLGIHVDSMVTREILEKCNHEDFVYLTTGYFNLTQLYKNTIIERSKAQFRILMAHPKANSFYKAKGPAGGIPSGYTKIALKFLDKIIKSGQTSRIKMFEYTRAGWTYHAKGLWLSSSKIQPPFLTMIGSSNFGERSVNRDLECQFLLATTSKSLQNELLRERTFLYEASRPFTKAVEADPERKTPFWVRVVIWLFRSYL